FFFFFQAEDGIRDFHVTGVQTCALPISKLLMLKTSNHTFFVQKRTDYKPLELWYTSIICHVRLQCDQLLTCLRCVTRTLYSLKRSEERRVGKECRSWLVVEHHKQEIKKI